MTTKQWTLTDLQQLITDGIEEGKVLEYKAADALAKTPPKRNEISKDVSSFANSNGGTLIYGIAEFKAKEKAHRPEKIDPIKRTDFSKETLEQVINSLIQPKIEGIDIQTIEVSTADNSVVYVVIIPKSTTAHMAANNKYHKRYNFMAEPMEDYEVRDVMNRGTHPKLEMDIQIVKEVRVIRTAPNPMYREGKPIEQISYKLKARMHNTGSVYAKYANFFLVLRPHWLASTELEYRDIFETKNGYEAVTLFGDNTVRDFLEYDTTGRFPRERYGPKRYDPILPGLYSKYEKFDLQDNYKTLDNDELVWTVYCDNAERRMGVVKIKKIPVKTVEISNEE